jgi:transposase-like protein
LLAVLTPEIVLRSFQELLEAEISALTRTKLHEHYPNQRSTYRNNQNKSQLTTQSDDLTQAIPLDKRSSTCGKWG